MGSESGIVKHLVLDSSVLSISKVEKLLHQLRSQYSFSEECYANMLVSVSEAVHNAIFHGNQLDESKKVRLSIREEKDELIFLISDEGNGFDPKEISNPCLKKNRHKIRGRGIYIMQKLADRCVFLDNGKTVNIGFKLA